jgi:hypothetical protein
VVHITIVWIYSWIATKSALNLGGRTWKQRYRYHEPSKTENKGVETKQQDTASALLENGMDGQKSVSTELRILHGRTRFLCGRNGRLEYAYKPKG